MHNAFTFDTLVWDWPIAVYLLLVGISAGMVTLSMLLRHCVPSEYHGSNRLIKATAIVAPLAVILGLAILIFHLTQPLTFWYLMVFYNPTSIMSLGVMLFQVYFVVMLLWLITLYHDGWLMQLEAIWHRPALVAQARKLAAMIVNKAAIIENLLLVLAILLGCYTGFLLSALKSFPLLNNPVLPVLFLVSGTTSGIAVMLLASAWGARPRVIHAPCISSTAWKHRWCTPNCSCCSRFLSGCCLAADKRLSPHRLRSRASGAAYSGLALSVSAL